MSRSGRRAIILLCLLALGAWRAPSGAQAAPKSTSNPLETFLAQGKNREGLEWLGSFGHGTPDEVRYRGLFHHGLAEPDATLQSLVPYYRAHPDDDVVALAVAEASLWKKDYKTAVTVLGQLRQPDAPQALRVRGLMLEQVGRLPEALALYNQAIPRLPLPWGTMERKALVLSWLKRFDEAAVTFKAVVASKQASLGLRQRCRVRLAELTAWNKDFDGALGQLAVLLKEEPRQVDALMLTGQILEWQGDFADAKKTYSRVLAIDAGQAEARLHLDKLLWVK
ncbi:MAG TPA: tetratricopeptide repeat protein [Polyangia bacterium]|nr:tetratricopeptide repeat protein [Polyangia bacterium]